MCSASAFVLLAHCVLKVVIAFIHDTLRKPFRVSFPAMSCRSSVYATANSAMAQSQSRTFIVRRLDGAEQEVTVDKKAVGEELMDKVSLVCKVSVCAWMTLRSVLHYD